MAGARVKQLQGEEKENTKQNDQNKTKTKTIVFRWLFHVERTKLARRTQLIPMKK